MAANALELYTRNFGALNLDDIVGATVKLALVTSSYTPNVDETSGHNVWANVSANEIAAGNGYTAGGLTLASVAKTAIANGFKLDSDDAVWTASGGNIPAHRYAVLYLSGSVWSLTNPLIGYILSDNSPADIPATTDGNTLTYSAPANGWFDVS